MQTNDTAILFSTRLETIIRAGGEKIIFVKTDEWRRAARLISALAETFTGNGGANPLNYDKGVVLWDLINGCTNENGDVVFSGKMPNAPTSSLGVTLGEYVNPESKDLNGHNFMVALWTHEHLKNNPALIQLVENTRHSLTFEKGKHKVNKRIFMVVPTSFTPPHELSTIPIVSLKYPSIVEMTDLVMEIMGTTISEASLRPTYTESEIGQIANACLGIGESEAVNAVTQALSDNMLQMPNVPASTIVEYVMKAKVQTIEKSPALSVLATVAIDDVGGLEVIKRDASMLRTAYSAAARALGVDMPRGCLLVGSAGTGKSLVAKAMANMLGVPAIELNIGNLMGGIVGQTESQTQQALDIIEAIGASVVMVDEIEKAMGGQDGSSGVSRRLLGNLLTRMSNNTSGTYWVFTSNNYLALPPELTRAGRMDTIYFVDLPNSSERHAIFAIHLRKRKIKTGYSLAAAVEATANFSAAEIEQVVKNTHIRMAHESGGKTGDFPESMLLDEISKLHPLYLSNPMAVDKMRAWGLENARNASAHDNTDTVPVSMVQSAGVTGLQRSRTRASIVSR